MSYLLLFSASFLAATVLPFSSEVMLLGMLTTGADSRLLLISAASGNTLGAAVNWCLGRYLLHYQDRRWFYFKPEQVGRSQRWFNRYGVWSLLFAWLPLGGDILTFIAGVMKVNFWLFLLLVALGKTARYLALILLSS